MSPGLIMSLLSILFPNTCHRSAFLHQTHCHLPAVRSLNFWPKFNHASCLLLLPSVLLPLLVALTHPRSTIYAILPFQQPYFLWEPLFTCRGVHLKPFCHPPLQPTRFLMAPSKFMAAVKILHIRFNCLQDLPSISFLFKTLHDIKSSFGISKLLHLPITVSILHQIHLVLQPSRCVNTDSSMLWAAFTVAFLCSLHSSELTCGGTFDAQIHLTRLEVSFYPDLLQPDYFEIVIKKSKTDPFWATAKLTIAKSNSPVCAVTASRDYFQTRTHSAAQPLFQFSDGQYLTRSSFTHNFRPC